MAEMTPMLRQYFEIKNEHKDYILFYRLGDFYEMFYDDAIIASEELDITLTKRNAGNGEKAPLCGVPYHSVDQYIAKLIDKRYKVAICEQVEDPSTAKGIVKREVVKLLTPGTISDPSMLNEDTNNYLMVIGVDKNFYAISYADVSTGLLKYRKYKIGDEESFFSAIYIIRPSEIVVKDNFILKERLENFIKATNFNIVITKEQRDTSSLDFQLESLKSFFKVNSLEGFGITNTDIACIDVLARLVDYLKLTQKTTLNHIRSIIYDASDKYMMIDAFTLKNLELIENMRSGDKKGSLLYVLDKTKTALGKRKLKSYIENPLLDKSEIELRLDRTEYLLKEFFVRTMLIDYLNEIYDIERLTTKLVLKTINPRDLIALKNSFKVFPDIAKLLKNTDEYRELFVKFNELIEITNLIENAINDDPPVSTRMGKFINSGYSKELDELRQVSENSEKILADLLETEREKTGIKSMKLGVNKVFGYYIEVTKTHKDKVPDYYIAKQTLVNADRYVVPELKILEEKILTAKEKINILEYNIYMDIVDMLLKQLDDMLFSANIIAEIDVYQSFASVSEKYSYVRPNITNDDSIKLVNSRHPVVESMLSYNEFVGNDASLNCEDSVISIITGPNMAGKSTYLRQVAIISLMMQIGCFVPCDSADISIVDRIFTRVGASDDLYRAKSTFMIEMLELANILNHATDKSLVILDEIGRGTSTFDGLSIAWALTEYIAMKIKCKTLFATHYHELTELENTLKGVVNYRITASEKNDDIVFLRKLVRGAASKSFGIAVAKLAGVPEDVIKRAKLVLKELEKNDIARPVISVNEEFLSNDNTLENDKTIEKYEELESYLLGISLENTSPINALMHLDKLIKILKD